MDGRDGEDGGGGCLVDGAYSRVVTFCVLEIV